MLGYYDYTVWLTYGSLISAAMGIMASLDGEGHPYVGIFYLLVCGLFDAFDGRVARTKKDRTEAQKKFGIQIDSLADLVAFGVLPGCIANAMICIKPETMRRYELACDAIIYFYILAALIRLAYFNVMEEERQKKEGGIRKYFEGLPVTSSALIFPSVMFFHYILPKDLTTIFLLVMLATGIAFISKIKVPKPQLKGIMIMIGIGAIEFLILGYTFFIARGGI